MAAGSGQPVHPSNELLRRHLYDSFSCTSIYDSFCVDQNRSNFNDILLLLLLAAAVC